MEVAQHGDQEINADELKTTIEKAKKCDMNESKCKLEEQFEVNNIVPYKSDTNRSRLTLQNGI